MKFTESHEWIKIENNIGTVGITHHVERTWRNCLYRIAPRRKSSEGRRRNSCFRIYKGGS